MNNTGINIIAAVMASISIGANFGAWQKSVEAGTFAFMVAWSFFYIVLSFMMINSDK